MFDTSFVEENYTSPVFDSSPNFANNTDFAGNMANKTLKELTASDVNYQALAIQYPDLDAGFELKSGLIHLLPKFHA